MFSRRPAFAFGFGEASRLRLRLRRGTPFGAVWPCWMTPQP